MVSVLRTSDTELASRRCNVGSEGADDRPFRQNVQASHAPSEMQNYRTTYHWNRQISYRNPSNNNNNNNNNNNERLIFLS